MTKNWFLSKNWFLTHLSILSLLVCINLISCKGKGKTPFDEKVIIDRTIHIKKADFERVDDLPKYFQEGCNKVYKTDNALYNQCSGELTFFWKGISRQNKENIEILNELGLGEETINVGDDLLEQKLVPDEMDDGSICFMHQYDYFNRERESKSERVPVKECWETVGIPLRELPVIAYWSRVLRTFLE